MGRASTAKSLCAPTRNRRAPAERDRPSGSREGGGVHGARRKLDSARRVRGGGRAHRASAPPSSMSEHEHIIRSRAPERAARRSPRRAAAPAAQWEGQHVHARPPRGFSTSSQLDSDTRPHARTPPRRRIAICPMRAQRVARRHRASTPQRRPRRRARAPRAAGTPRARSRPPACFLNSAIIAPPQTPHAHSSPHTRTPRAPHSAPP